MQESRARENGQTGRAPATASGRDSQEVLCAGPTGGGQVEPGEVQGGVSFALARTTVQANPVGRAKGGKNGGETNCAAYPPPSERSKQREEREAEEEREKNAGDRGRGQQPGRDADARERRRDLAIAAAPRRVAMTRSTGSIAPKGARARRRDAVGEPTAPTGAWTPHRDHAIAADGARRAAANGRDRRHRSPGGRARRHQEEEEAVST